MRFRFRCRVRLLLEIMNQVYEEFEERIFLWRDVPLAFLKQGFDNSQGTVVLLLSLDNFWNRAGQKSFYLALLKLNSALWSGPSVCFSYIFGCSGAESSVESRKWNELPLSLYSRMPTNAHAVMLIAASVPKLPAILPKE